MINADELQKRLSDLWRKEDWWTVWLGFVLIIFAVISILPMSIIPSRWGDDVSLTESVPLEALPGILATGIICVILFSISIAVTERQSLKKFFVGFPIIYSLALLAMIFGNYTPGRHYGFDNVIWALVLGLLISNIFKTPTFIKQAVRTELYIKTGLVLMGASILFDRIIVLGALGLGVAWFVTPIVLGLIYYYSQRVLKMREEKELAITIAAATSVCGVSAAIAVGTASKAKKEQISLAISISLIFTVMMMVIMPAVIKYLGIDLIVGGALIGGTIDSTGAVVAAGSMLGQEAMEVASVIKMIQNVLIGVIAFVVALIWVAYYEKTDTAKRRVSSKEIWIRMPKFVIGFFVASILFSFILADQSVEKSLPILNGYRNIFFTLAFISIGLDSNFKDMAKILKTGKPVLLYIVGQTMNILLTLLAAWFFFSGRFFSLPF